MNELRVAGMVAVAVFAALSGGVVVVAVVATVLELVRAFSRWLQS